MGDIADFAGNVDVSCIHIELMLLKFFSRNYLDHVYTVHDPHGHNIEFGQFAVIFTVATSSMMSCSLV